jgi:hypothetical protein
MSHVEIFTIAIAAPVTVSATAKGHVGQNVAPSGIR